MENKNESKIIERDAENAKEEKENIKEEIKEPFPEPQILAVKKTNKRNKKEKKSKNVVELDSENIIIDSRENNKNDPISQNKKLITFSKIKVENKKKK